MTALRILAFVTASFWTIFTAIAFIKAGLPTEDNPFTWFSALLLTAIAATIVLLFHYTFR